MTAFALVYIAGTPFTANPVTLTFVDPSTPLYITYQFPAVTLTSLTPLETLTFVHQGLCVANFRLKPSREGTLRPAILNIRTITVRVRLTEAL